MKTALAALFSLALALPAWSQDAEDTAPPDTTEPDLADFLDALRLDCEGEECDTEEEETDPVDPPADAEASSTEPDPQPAAVVETNAPDETTTEPVAIEPGTIVARGPGTPLLNSTEYLLARGESTFETLDLVWTIETFNAGGEAIGEPRTRRLIMAPDFVRDENGSDVRLYDFLASRLLELDLEAGTFRNTAFEADVRRRLDTYLGLSQSGTLDIIPLGPETGFERFWLESAMGLRRDPAVLEAELADLALRIQRGSEQNLFSAQFSLPDMPEEEDGLAETETPGPEAEPAASANNNGVALSATPIDLDSGESVVFDPTQGAEPITLDFDSGNNLIDYPESLPADQAQAELFRRWMRHALPIHPDVLARLRGAPAISDQFSFFVISPESPEGRREVWTLESRTPGEPGLRLEPDLQVTPPGPAPLSVLILPAAANATGERPPTEGIILDIIADLRAQRDFARAYLTAFQETSHHGPCPPPGQNRDRAVCEETSSIIAAGLGNPAFEAAFGAVNLIGGEAGDQILDALSPYLAEETLAGAAARTIVANELLAWAARDPDGPPADLDPFRLIAESITIDPYALGNYRYFGNAMLSLRNQASAWAAYDAARAIPMTTPSPFIAQINDLDRRLRTLAPDFFLPR